jgi:hypothetical protein
VAHEFLRGKQRDKWRLSLASKTEQCLYSPWEHSTTEQCSEFLHYTCILGVPGTSLGSERPETLAKGCSGFTQLLQVNPEISIACYNHFLTRYALINIPNHAVISFYVTHVESRYGTVSIALRYGLDDRGSRVQFPTGAGNFSLHHRVQNGSGAHPASYPLGTRGSFPGGKSSGAWSWPLTSI